MQGAKYRSNVTIPGKVVVITGANTGIGKETAKELARRGAKVYMACRDMKRCNEARDDIIFESKNPNVYCRECDLASFESIKKFVSEFKKESNQLDILIANGGVMRCPRMLTKEGIELQIGVNHFGHFLLTTSLLDLLKVSQLTKISVHFITIQYFFQKSAPSRIIVVSSLAHTRGHINTNDLNSEKNYDSGAAYNQSKLANVLFTRALSKRLQGTDVTVNALHPGVVSTELGRHMGVFSSWWGKIFVRPFLWPFMKTPESGAQTTLYLALDPEVEKVTGKYFSDCELKQPADAALDDTMAEWLWQVSEKWVRLEKVPAAS